MSIAESLDGKKMSESEVKNLKKKFAKNENIVTRSLGQMLIKVEDKRFFGPNHYYFNIPGFFDPDRGFFTCLSIIFERYLKVCGQFKKYVKFSELLSWAPNKICNFLGVEEGGHIASCINYAVIWIELFGVTQLAFLICDGISIFCPVAGVIGKIAFTAGTIFYALESHKNRKNYEKLGDYGGLKSKILMELERMDILKVLSEYNVIEIIADDKEDNIFSSFLPNSKAELRFWKIPGIEQAPFLNENTANPLTKFYIELIEGAKSSLGITGTIKEMRLKYGDIYNAQQKNLRLDEEANKILLDTYRKDPNNGPLKELLKAKGLI